MTLVITVAQQKGGAGKTTLVVQLATAFKEAGRNVAVVDTDPQASLTGWMRVREHEARDAPELRFSMIGGWRAEVELDRLKREAEIILVDTPPHADTEARVAMRAADLVLVPCQPSPADLWASRATFDRAVKEAKPSFLMLNRVPPRSRAIDDAQAMIAREGWPVLNASLGNRQGFVTSFGRGLGVVENEPKSAAAIEVRAVLQEMAQHLR
jgi:chromosome partitioning protein